MDRKLKHLEFVQGVINRLSTNSFLLKGWSVILVSALLALGATDSNLKFMLLAYAPALVFWGLDGYFLGLERVYRNHYERVRQKSPEQIDFSMNVSDLKEGFSGWVEATFSKTIVLFHGTIVGTIIVVMMLLLRDG